MESPLSKGEKSLGKVNIRSVKMKNPLDKNGKFAQ
jgi:hypothetical protein